MLRPRDPLARLARRAVSGDRRAFTRLYRELHPLVARFVARRVDSRADAEELVAEVFRRLVEHLGEFDPARGSMRAWVLRIARNAVIDHYRTRKSPIALEAIADGLYELAGPLDHLLADERAARVRALLDSFPLETRRLLALRYGDGLRHAEIAELLGLAEVVVRKRISRAVRELRVRSSSIEDDAPEVSHAV
jgi:RNA polymerase sigma-70 factor (ECF subfamily)